MRMRTRVLASVGLAAAVAVVPRATAGTHVDSYTVNAGAAAAPTWQSSPITDPADRMFVSRAGRAEETTTTVEPITTTTVPPTTTTVRPRPVVTTTSSPPTTEAPPPPPAPVVEASQPAASTDAYQPYPECMEQGHFDAYGNDVAGRHAEMIRCWDPLVRRWNWPSITKVYSVMWCESKGDPWAGQDHPYKGLMQIGPYGPYNPWDNMVEAWRKSSGGTNWAQWSCT